MNIINIEHISKIYGEKVIFDDASFGVHEGDKVGIVGINGTGKSTLLKLVAGLEETDSGQIIRRNGLKIACLAQDPSRGLQLHIPEESKGRDHRAERMRQIHAYEDDRRPYGTGFRPDRDRRYHPHRLSVSG